MGDACALRVCRRTRQFRNGALRGIVWVISVSSVFWLSASFVFWLGEQQRTANSQNTEITEITEPTPISKQRSSWLFAESGG